MIFWDIGISNVPNLCHKALKQVLGDTYMKKFDVAIIGGGIGGLMSAYRLTQERPDCKVILFEKGHSIEKRVCPIVAGKTKTCIKCASCSIMEGLAGAGAFSDGKYVISTEYGGWLPDFLPKKTVIDYIEEADKVLMSFGAPKERFMPSNELKKKCLEYDLHMSQAQLKHLGTDANFDTMSKMCAYLKERAEILCETDVYDVDRKTNTVYFRNKDGEQTVQADNIIFAVGRAGSRFFAEWCHTHDIPMTNNQVDVGVRDFHAEHRDAHPLAGYGRLQGLPQFNKFISEM